MLLIKYLAANDVDDQVTVAESSVATSDTVVRDTIVENPGTTESGITARRGSEGVVQGSGVPGATPHLTHLDSSTDFAPVTSNAVQVVVASTSIVDSASWFTPAAWLITLLEHGSCNDGLELWDRLVQVGVGETKLRDGWVARSDLDELDIVDLRSWSWSCDGSTEEAESSSDSDDVLGDSDHFDRRKFTRDCKGIEEYIRKKIVCLQRCL